jgi:hypothetical protein
MTQRIDKWVIRPWASKRAAWTNMQVPASNEGIDRAKNLYSVFFGMHGSLVRHPKIQMGECGVLIAPGCRLMLNRDWQKIVNSSKQNKWLWPQHVWVLGAGYWGTTRTLWSICSSQSNLYVAIITLAGKWLLSRVWCAHYAPSASTDEELGFDPPPLLWKNPYIACSCLETYKRSRSYSSIDNSFVIRILTSMTWNIAAFL